LLVKLNIIDERGASPQINLREFPGTNARCSAVYKLEASKGFGNSSFIEEISVLPFKLARITGISPQNSQISWRHAPQGGVRASVSVATAMASKPRSPSLMALRIATRSAHTVRP